MTTPLHTLGIHIASTPSAPYQITTATDRPCCFAIIDKATRKQKHPRAKAQNAKEISA